MGIVYAISTNKGGVGKTSLVANITASLAKEHNKKVLVVDVDGQGNLAMAFGYSPKQFEDTMYDVFMSNRSMDDIIIEIDKNLDFAPSNRDMNFIELDILPYFHTFAEPYHLLKRAIDSVRDRYDYIFIDTPPSMSLIASNVFTATDKVIIPFVPEMFAVEGLVNVVENILDFDGNPKLEIAGVVGMMVNSRTILHTSLLQQARKYCYEQGYKMYDTVIPQSIKFASDTAYEKVPSVWSSPNHPVVTLYRDLVNEILAEEKEGVRG